MDYAFSAAQSALRKALSAATDELVLEAWAASKNLGSETYILILDLHYAKAILSTTRGMEIDNPGLNYMLLKLQLLAYDAGNVLDVLNYFCTKDEINGTCRGANENAGGCVRGFFLQARQTAKVLAAKLKPSTSLRDPIHGEYDEQDISSHASLMQKLASIKCSSARPGGKGCQVRTKQTPKLKFDRTAISRKMTDIVEKLNPLCAKISTVLYLELLGSK